MAVVQAVAVQVAVATITDMATKVADVVQDVVVTNTTQTNNRVGRGITPPPSHTTVHALAHGGFF